VVRDGSANGLLLTTTGNTAIVWTLVSTIPVSIAAIDFGVPADAAALVGSKVYVLSAKSLFVADLGDATPTPVLVPLNGMKPSWIARTGNTLALAEVTADQTQTNVRLLSGTLTTVVDGTPVGGIAANDNLVALFTYLG